MRYVDALLANRHYLTAIDTIEHNETTRRFCRHGLSHALDVARMSWIYCLENHLKFDKETVYLAALLHDIGRSVSNDHHDEEGVHLSKILLAEIGVAEPVVQDICDAIGGHRVKKTSIDFATATLGDILSWADKRSRPCFHCKATSDCKWEASKKNSTILT